MRILGIDPALGATGYGVIAGSAGSFELVEAGLIKTKPKDGIAARLSAIYRGVSGLIRDTKPEILALEKLFAHYKHPTTALLMGHARGVVCLAAGESGIPVVSFASTRVKMAVVSRGHAPKEMVQRAVQMHLGLKTRARTPFDVTDAIAIALTYGLTHGRLGEYAPRVRSKRDELLEGLEDEFEEGIRKK